MRELRVVLLGNIYHAEHLVDGEPDPFIKDLFDGEHVLPTPYTANARAENVVAELRHRNPHVAVSYKGDDE